MRAGPTEPHGHDTDFLHLKNWVLAHDPTGLLAATTEAGTGVGLAVVPPVGTISAAMVTDQHLVSTAPDSTAAKALRALVTEWENAGRPSTRQLPARLVPTDTGWRLRISVPA